jgi:hypothetical protein
VNFVSEFNRSPQVLKSTTNTLPAGTEVLLVYLEQAASNILSDRQCL